MTGTGTDVGKTIASAVLLKTLSRRAYYKPYQTDAKKTNGRLILPDIETVCALANMRSEDCYNEYALSPARSPYHAAKITNASFDVARVVRTTETLMTRYETVVLEGAGGLYVPIRSDYCCIDLFAELHRAYGAVFSLVLVSPAALGAINHTLLSYAALKEKGIPLTAVFLMQKEKEKNEADDDAAEYLKERLNDAAVIAVPFLSREDFSDERFPFLQPSALKDLFPS